MGKHEKFFAFVLLGAALMAMAFVLYLRPLADSTANSGVLQILNMIIGALISGFGAATQALFRVKDTAPEEPVPVSEPVTPTPAQPEG